MMWCKTVTVYFKEFAGREEGKVLTILATKSVPSNLRSEKKLIRSGH
jgi:hypothetical protein